MKIKIKNTGLIGYYLEQKFRDDEMLEKSGLVFSKSKKTIWLDYKDDTDLANRISYILLILTDR